MSPEPSPDAAVVATTTSSATSEEAKLYVPEVSDCNALENAEREQNEEYGSQRRVDLALRKIELENDRIEKENDRIDVRDREEMKTRHLLAKFLIFGVLSFWLVSIIVILVLVGTKILELPPALIETLVIANPIGIGGLAIIVMKHYFPPKGKD
jgi:hypothetical protein